MCDIQLHFLLPYLKSESNKTSYFFILNIVVKNRYYLMFWVLSITCLCSYHSAVALVTVNKTLLCLVIGCFQSLNDVCGSSLSALIHNFYSPVILFFISIPSWSWFILIFLQDIVFLISIPKIFLPLVADWLFLVFCSTQTIFNIAVGL